MKRNSLHHPLQPLKQWINPQLLWPAIVLLALLNGAPAQETRHQPSGPQAAHGEHVMIAPEHLVWEKVVPALPPGAQMAVLRGDPSQPGLFTLRFKVPADYKIPPHWHPADEHVTVVSGSLYMGMGEEFDESKAKRISVGGFAVMPIGVRHFVFTKEETVIQLHGMGPWGIHYVNPEDDPRRK